MGIQVTLTTHTHAAEMKNPGKDPNPAHFFLEVVNCFQNCSDLL